MPSGSGSPSSAQSALDLFTSEASLESPVTVVLPPPSAASTAAARSVTGLPDVLPVTEILTAPILPRPTATPVLRAAETARIDPAIARPEPAMTPKPSALPSVAPSGAPISIVALCASRVELDRNEAVSIVQGICHAILGGQVAAIGAPLELEDAFLDQHGTITLHSRPDPQVALPAVKHLLHALLPSNEFLVAKAMPDSTLDEFSRSLDHFMPADALEAGQKVYLRWRTRPVPDEALPPLEPIQAPEPEETQASIWRRRLEAIWQQFIEGLRARRWHVEPLLVIAVILGTASVALFAWGFKSRRSEPASEASAAPLSAPAAAIPDTVETAPPAADKPVTDSRKRGSVQQKAGSVSRVSRTSPAARAAASAPADAQRPTSAAPLATVPFTGASALAGGSLTTLSRIDSANRPAAASAPKADAPPDALPVNLVFDSGQSDVIPPEFVYPLLAVPLPVAGVVKGQPSIEVTINEQGTIDGVKASAPPTTIAQAVKMLGELSAAKAWRFRPASRNGHPVKYRLVVPLSIL
jgi:hypothetical protein